MKRDTDYLLRRLQRLRRLRVDYAPQLNDVGVRMLDRAIRAAVGDLTDAGRAEEAADELHLLAVGLASGGAL